MPKRKSRLSRKKSHGRKKAAPKVQSLSRRRIHSISRACSGGRHPHRLPERNSKGRFKSGPYADPCYNHKIHSGKRDGAYCIRRSCGGKSYRKYYSKK